MLQSQYQRELNSHLTSDRLQQLIHTSNSVVVKITYRYNNFTHWLVWPVKSYGFDRQLSIRLSALSPLIDQESQNKTISVYGFKETTAEIPLNPQELNDFVTINQIAQLEL